MAKVVEQSQRLDRIETKIDKLAETVVQMARAEEKLVALESDKKILMERMLAFEDRLYGVEKKGDETAAQLSVVNKVFWITTSCIITAMIGTYFASK